MTAVTDSYRGRCPLSERELEMLALLSSGLKYKQIAIETGLSASTVRSHLHNAFDRLGVTDRAQAVIFAAQRGWIDIPLDARPRAGGPPRVEGVSSFSEHPTWPSLPTLAWAEQVVPKDAVAVFSITFRSDGETFKVDKPANEGCKGVAL